MSKCKDQLKEWTQQSNAKHTHTKWEYYETFMDKSCTLCLKYNHYVHNMLTPHLPLWNSSNTMHLSLLTYTYSKCLFNHPQSPYGIHIMPKEPNLKNTIWISIQQFSHKQIQIPLNKHEQYI
jgi:hypothetical protein